MNSNANPVNLVVIGLGAALVVFIAGVSTVLAVHHPVPTEMWAAGGAISGALVGLLVPAPKRGGGEPAAEPVQGQPVQGQPVQAQPVQGQPVQGQPVQAQPVQAQPVQGQPVQAQPAPAQPAQPQPVQVQPGAAPQPVVQVPQPVQQAAGGGGEAVPSEQLSTHPAFVVLLFIVFLATAVAGVALSAGWIVPPSGFEKTLHETTTAVVALASASGTALIGVFAPTPSKQ